MVCSVEADVANTESEPRTIVRKRSYASEPVVRVCLVRGELQCDFRISGQFSVSTAAGEVLYGKIRSRRRWRIRIDESQPSKFEYGCLLDVYRDRESAVAQTRQLADRGLESHLLHFGDTIVLPGDLIVDNTAYAATLGWWDSEADARAAYRMGHFDGNPEILRLPVSAPRGQIEIFDLDFEESAIVADGLTLTLSGKESRITLLDLSCRRPDGRRYRQTRQFTGELEARVDPTGQLTVVLNVPLETYLAGIDLAGLASEFPPEALKARLVALRGYCIRQLGRNHPGEDYDCTNGQGTDPDFKGLEGADPKIAMLLEKTAGEVLLADGAICLSDSTRNCGGISEDGVSGPDGDSHPYLLSTLDSPKRAPTGFSQGVVSRTLVERWVQTRVHSYCNLLEWTDVPEVLAFGRRYRWEFRFSRQEIEASLQKYLKINVGVLYDIIPLAWGASGRIHRLEILGSRQNVVVEGEARIRTAMVGGDLPSTCFTITTIIGNDGEPVEFLFHGAGEGPGVGLCQAGAIGMALSKIRYRKILAQYFPGTTLKRIY